MRIPDSQLLAEVGLTLYERKSLITLIIFGVADAAAICKEGGIPTSKIYRAMEKLALLGLVQIQSTRPKIYAALPPDAVIDRVVEIARERADRFAASAGELQRLLASLPGRVRGKHLFTDLALGAESHVKRHLTHLATAQKTIVSYMERSDLDSIDQAVDGGFPILRRIARNATDNHVRHQVVFGFTYQTAPRLLEFLRKHPAEIRHLTGVRYSGELGHPFHVVDDEIVVLPLYHPFVPEGRFASLLVRDRDLAKSLTDGFDELWRKAMKSLQEINFDPRGTR
ncbi:MAG: TrmB family transcriptional regulator [Betaproteobacteria bacterium]|nr:TrmB family transcriptional regulator [Betaproteobacteria bacterium]